MSLIDRWEALSDRQRDAVVALGVCGWKWYRIGVTSEDYPTAGRFIREGDFDYKRYGYELTDMTETVFDCDNTCHPKYTTSIDTAAQVRPQNPDLFLDVDEVLHIPTMERWWCAAYELNGEIVGEATQPTEPRARCLAALLTAPEAFESALAQVETHE